MSHFAKIENGIVTQVIVIEQDVLNTGLWGDPKDWIQTSYNTRAGQHPEGRPLRGNYAGIGFTYDKTNDVFYPPQPFPSWTISAPTWAWTAPVPYPTDDKLYAWNEETKTWDEIVEQTV
jgi:hypothetical protein